jgi:BNR/Asp-box repeat
VVDAAAPAQNWSALASSASGNRIAAAVNGGGIHLSVDGGATWTRSNAPSAAWTAVAMNPEGTRLAAVAGGGLLYTSADGGMTWTPRTSTGRAWTGVFLSDDGQRIVGTVVYGAIHVSTDGGASFTESAGTAGASWRSVAGSGDGLRLLAVAANDSGFQARQGVYVSLDGGVTWTRRNVTGPTPPTGNWTYAAASANGQRMAAIDNGGNPWVSDDGGTTWSMRFGYSNWSGLAVSGDGSVVSALEPRDDTYGHTGYVFVSPDGGGATWNWYGENRWYRAVSLSLDGNWIVVGDAGPNGSGGRLYTSQGNRTSGGTLGSITGGAGQMVEVIYQGNGRFGISASSCGPFTIR